MGVPGLYPGWTVEMLQAHFDFYRWHRGMKQQAQNIADSLKANG